MYNVQFNCLTIILSESLFYVNHGSVGSLRSVDFFVEHLSLFNVLFLSLRVHDLADTGDGVVDRKSVV